MSELQASATITGVAGITRSGTSLAMRVLHAGGLDLFYDEGHDISYETNLIHEAPLDSWLDQAEGRAVKFLDLHGYMPLPPDRAYRFILMCRDSWEQARSIQKFMHLVAGVQTPDSQLPALRKSVERDYRTVRKHLETRGPILRVQFEDLLSVPDATTARIADFCNIDPSYVEVMADQVLQRGPECFDGLLELELPTVYDNAAKYMVTPNLMWQRIRDVKEGADASRRD